jgi:hypothetical protein
MIPTPQSTLTRGPHRRLTGLRPRGGFSVAAFPRFNPGSDTSLKVVDDGLRYISIELLYLHDRFPLKAPAPNCTAQKKRAPQLQGSKGGEEHRSQREGNDRQPTHPLLNVKPKVLLKGTDILWREPLGRKL